ncbi:DUF6386 family protein [Pseudomonas violetae]|uniref:DUF6386 family protein n=1 Tax=Pseudomonas violetae TaxID=2915813 RepID=A0ABT0F9T7_9PSED|nr:DUF6386 family protein [Pseudomonas violetae]MCK1794424.1 DUF6386 family protein [Pseudomonas violetae]
MNKEFSIVTDTATIAIFDLQSIKHRISDAPDWWSIVEDEIQEVNNGNIAIFGLGEDGKFDIKISEDVRNEDGVLNLKFLSGYVFVGAGEDTTGGELEPDGSDVIQGELLEFEPGSYQVKYKKVDGLIQFSFSRSNINVNDLTVPIRF